MKRALVLSCAIFISGLVNANDETCTEAASKINSIIEDWNTSVIEYSTPDKNPSVIAMYNDYKAGNLEANFIKKCNAKWNIHQDIFECFSGIRSDIGAATCMHPDTNKNNWEY